MHTIAQIFDYVVSPLTRAASFLATQFSGLACGVPLGSFGLAAVVLVSIVFGAMCGAWAISERMRSNRYRERLFGTLRRLRAGIHLRDALLESFPEAAVVLRCSPDESLSFAGGRKLLQHCLSGPDAARLAARIDDLLTRGTAFELVVRTISIREIAVRGRLLGDRAVVFLRHENRSAAQNGREEAGAKSQSEAWDARAHVCAKLPRIQPSLGRVHGVVRLEPSNDASGATGDGEEGVVRIGSDGHVKQYNQAFADQWSLGDDLLRREPHLSEIANACLASKGRDAIWDVVAAATRSAEPERLSNWGTLTRGDGRPVQLSLSRLADGSTLVTFTEALAAVAALPAPYEEIAA
jgi:PAS domain-containing protein